MKKKVVCLFLAVLMVYFALGTAAFAAGEVFSDVTDGVRREAVEVLNELGILKGYDDGTFRPEQNITRAELTASVMNALGYGGIAFSGGAAFEDVTADHWAYHAIYLARELHMINGIDDSHFAPERNVTGPDAVKLVVSALGYGPVAEARGGYPSGYMVVAGEQKLLKSVSVPNGEISRGDVAVLLYHAISVDIVTVNVFPGGGYTLDTTEETILSKLLGGQQVTGQVTETPFTKKSLNDDEVMIEEDGGTAEVYRVGSTDAASLLGCNVQAVYREPERGDTRELLSIRERSGRNDLLVIDAGNLEDGTDKTVVRYNEDDARTQTARLDANAKFVYNGSYASYQQVTDAMMRPATGSLRLNDTTGDGLYDFVEINDVKSVVLDNADSERNSLYFKDNNAGIGQLRLDDLDRVADRSEGRNAEPKLEEYKADSIFSVQLNLERTMARFTVGGELVEGMVGQLSEQDHTAVIEGEEYSVAEYCNKTVKAGDTGTFYIDGAGYLVYIEQGFSKAKRYGYLYRAAVDGLSDGAQLKILTQDNEKKVFNTASKLRVEEPGRGTMTLTPEETARKFSGAKQLVQYQVNGEDRITKLILPEKPVEAGYRKDEFSCDREAELYFKNTKPKSLGGEYVLSEDALIFEVPEDEEDDYNYHVRTPDVFKADRTYRVQIYDATEAKVTPVVVLLADVSTEAKLVWNSPAAVVQKISRVMDQEGEERSELAVMVNGKLERAMIDNSESDELLEDADDPESRRLSRLPFGTVIQYRTNFVGDIDAFRVLYLPGETEMAERNWDSSGYNVELYTVFGIAAAKEANALAVSVNGGRTSKGYPIDAPNIYLVNLEKESISEGSMSDIVPYTRSSEPTKVLLRCYKNTVGDLVIFE